MPEPIDVVVTGIGLTSALGNLADSWQSLMAGRSGIRVAQPFAALSPQPLAMLGQQPAHLATLTQQVVKDALQDAGLMPPLENCGVVVGSSRGNQVQWEMLARQFSSNERASIDLTDWLETLPNGAAIATARLLQTRALVLSPMSACATGLWAIAQGFDLIRSGICQRVIAGAIEAPITPLTLKGFERMGALAKTGAYPFDLHREGLVLAEGGAVLVLESAALARDRSASVYGQVRGFGLTADAYHMSAPEMGSQAAIIAVKQCLKRSELPLEAIGYIHAHGTATQLNDRHEAHLIQTLFPHGVSTSSTKGATGHAIGASGALGAAFCLMALKHQKLPPCVGLNESEFALDLVQSSRSVAINAALCLAFGFGGQNAAIVLSQWNK